MKKPISWLHISDIHFNKATDWRDEKSRQSLLTYLGSLFDSGQLRRPDLIFCTGDIAFGELRSEPLDSQYESAISFFNKLRSVCGSDSPIPLERLYVVPGNHDVDRSKINKDAQQAYINFARNSYEHISDINSRVSLRAVEFNDAMRRLSAFSNFVEKYLPHQFDSEGRLLFAKTIDIDGLKVGIAGFNSAWTCAGDEDDRNIWIGAEFQTNKVSAELVEADIRIGLIHHPSDWFVLADRDIVNARIPSEFDFWLHGHTHNAWVNPGHTHVVIAAGAVGASVSEEFGVNLTTLEFADRVGITSLHSKKAGASNWTVAPVADHAPIGTWSYPLPRRVVAMATSKGYCRDQRESVNATLTSENVNLDSGQDVDDGLVLRVFNRRLDEALRSFSTYSNMWVERTICEASELDTNADESAKITVRDYIQNPISATIKAPQQYGLTCLAHKITAEAWSQASPQLFLYLDTRSVQPHRQSVAQSIADELRMLGRKKEEVKCVILDSFVADEKDSNKILSLLVEIFSETAILVMQQLSAGNFSVTRLTSGQREFKDYYLWSLSRNVMRNIVATFNETRLIGDEDAVTARLAADLEVLNLHRTPLNCITLLKVSEFEFDESPVNRCDLIRRVLFVLFNVDSLPSYKSRPDVKDCEFVLGFFCENLIRENKFIFARDKFLADLQGFCRSNLIDLETHSVFDVLFQNNIIVKTGHLFRFKFSYWVFYFAAQRMHHDSEFARFILSGRRYSLYPELIEFYTGIDRRREDALNVLISDLRDLHDEVRAQCGLPEDVNPYKFAIWKASDPVITEMQEELANGVKVSNLPTVIKDQYADKNYNKARPYNQEINDVLHGHSFIYMTRAMSAGARALRNSDYVPADVKKRLMREILCCWRETTRVLFVVLPLLVRNGYATYDGMAFVLGDGFGTEAKERFLKGLACIPHNVARWSQDDLYSRKMGPLLIDQAGRDDIGDLERHELILILLATRPRDWERAVQRYIAENSKDSFYLMDIYHALRHQYQYGYMSDSVTLSAIEHLIKMAIVKHLTGEKHPTQKSFKKLKGEVLPQREARNDD